MIEALQAVEYELPSFEIEPQEVQLGDAARTRVQIRPVRGASDATYLVNSFGDELLMQLQLNVHRLVVVYRVPALEVARSMRIRSQCGSNAGGWALSTPDGNSVGGILR
jgi:hypothetical protein